MTYSDRVSPTPNRIILQLLLTTGLILGCQPSSDPRVASTDAPPTQHANQPLDRSREATVLRLKESLNWLADDARRGRGPHSPELDESAQFLVDRFAAAGAHGIGQPLPNCQEFLPEIAWVVHDDSSLTITDNSRPTAPQPKLHEDFTPLPGSPSVSFSGPVAFLGYGISAPDLAYDEFADVDIQGKVVLLLRHEPQLDDRYSPFDGDRLSPHGMLARKANLAAQHGAAALLVCTDQAHLLRRSGKAEETQDALMSLSGKLKPAYPLPVLHVKRTLVQQWLTSSDAPKLSEIERHIDANLQPFPIPLEHIHAQGKTHLERTSQTLKNVVAVLPGKGKLAEESLIIGAHYDHLGMGRFGSLAPWTIAVHNGADDNASGTAALIELAQRLGQRSSDNQRRIVLIGFSGEEMGLLGSEHFCRKPLIPLETTTAMLNLDMVGRLSGNQKLEVYGVATAKQLKQLVSETTAQHQIPLLTHPEGYGPSDHESFHQRGLPVLHFFTGLHRNYHRPSDDAHLIDYSGLASICDVVEDIAWELATRPQRLETTSTAIELDLDLSQFPQNTRDNRHPLGLSLRPLAQDSGFQITELNTAGRAANAQLLRGDVILSINDAPLQSLEQWHQCVANTEEPLVLIVRRGSVKLKLVVPPIE